MIKTRQEIKALAREGTAHQRGSSILILLVFMLIYFAGALPGSIPIIGGLIVWATIIFVDMPLMVGMYGSYFKIYNKAETRVGDMFSCFSAGYMRKVGGMAWMLLWVILWSLISIPVIIVGSIVGAFNVFTAGFLFGSAGAVGAAGALLWLFSLLMIAAWVPAIIKGISYSMTVFILEHFPDVPATDALKISMRITQGYKFDIFVFCLSFIGWFILSALTLGILYIVYVGPYFYASFAGLYQELRDKALAEGRVTREELGMETPYRPSPHDPMVFR